MSVFHTSCHHGYTGRRDDSKVATGADTFKHLACNYVLCGRPTDELCSANATVAEAVGLFQTAQVRP